MMEPPSTEARSTAPPSAFDTPAPILLGPPPSCPPPRRFSFPRPPVRLTTEFDSENFVLFHKISFKILDGLAKLKLKFNNNDKGEISEPVLSFTSTHLSFHYDVDEQNALIHASCALSNNLRLKASHDIKAKQGRLEMFADIPPCTIELSSSVPSSGLPSATLKFPSGKVSVSQNDKQDLKNQSFSVNGTIARPLLNGKFSAIFSDESLNLRYSFKDKGITLTPTLSTPSNSVSLAFKRRFDPSNKFSYWHHFGTNFWSTVYKHTEGKDYKIKVGYDSKVRVGWASLWVGGEGGKLKASPLKTKLQFMLQVPQDNLSDAALLFRVKKRWDF